MTKKSIKRAAWIIRCVAVLFVVTCLCMPRVDADTSRTITDTGGQVRLISDLEGERFEEDDWLTRPNGASENLAHTASRSSGRSGGQDQAPGADPSDPTQVTFHLMQEFEWNKMSDSQGDMLAYKLSPFIPLKFAEQSFLANIDVPLTYAGTDVLGHHTGFGDTRLKLFWLIGTDGEFVRAIVPSFDAIAPTGDVDKGLGGGSWVLMPNVVFALQPAENLAVYPFFRYVHADGPRPFFISDSGIPASPVGDANVAASNTRGLNMEFMMVFGLQNAVMDWVSVVPDYFQNFTGDRGHTFQMKYDSGVSLTDSLFLIFKFWHPVSGDVSSDFTIGLSLDWYPG